MRTRACRNIIWFCYIKVLLHLFLFLFTQLPDRAYSIWFCNIPSSFFFCLQFDLAHSVINIKRVCWKEAEDRNAWMEAIRNNSISDCSDQLLAFSVTLEAYSWSLYTNNHIFSSSCCYCCSCLSEPSQFQILVVCYCCICRINKV